MASTTPQVKVETSPTGSLLSDPSGVYPSLFSGSTVASSAAATPTDTGAASNFLAGSGDDMDFASKGPSFQASLASLAEEGDDISDASLDASKVSVDADSAASSDKRPTKKRKSWGQVLPEPKTNLPPRYVSPLRDNCVVESTPHSETSHHFANYNLDLGNGRKLKTKRSSVVSNVFYGIGGQLSLLESGSVSRWKPWRSGTKSLKSNWQRFGERTRCCTSA